MLKSARSKQRYRPMLALAAWTSSKGLKRLFAFSRFVPATVNTALVVWGSFDRNRVNVAISRAQCLAVMVADPRIAATPPGSLDEMTLINLFCKLSAQPALA